MKDLILSLAMALMNKCQIGIAQENYSDNFVVIANQVGVVKAKIRLLSRTDKVEVKYLVPSLESVEELIGDKAYFQEYAQANVWRGAVPKKLLQERFQCLMRGKLKLASFIY